MVRVLFFGEAAEKTGQRIVDVELSLINNRSAKEIVSYLIKVFPTLSDLGDSSILAINQEYADISSKEAINLTSSDEIAFIPPISGG